MSEQSVGFIGLGTMGGAVAARLVSQGFDVEGFDLNPAALEAFASLGGRTADCVEAVISECDVVFTSLPLPEHVEALWDENRHLLEAGAITVDTSTIDAGTARKLEASHQEVGAHFICCTLGKTPELARQGLIPAYIGGEAGAVQAVLPIVSAFTTDIFDMGSVEGSAVFKLVSNLIGMTNLSVLAEGAALAEHAGIPAQTFEDALRTTGGWSVQADLRLRPMVARDFTTRFSASLAAKDLRLATTSAATAGIPTPTGFAALALMLSAVVDGRGRDDAAAVISAVAPTP